MYKIVNNDAPPYLQELLPNTVNESTNYNLRNSQNFDVPFFTFVLIWIIFFSIYFKALESAWFTDTKFSVSLYFQKKY